MYQANLVVLLFGVIALVRLRESVESAALNVFLPVLLLVPAIYSLHIPHLPPISCSDAALIPIGFAAIASRFRTLRLRRTDLWILAFAFAGFYTDCLNLDVPTAIYNFLDPGLLGGVLAYFVGRFLIEQGGNRERFVRRVVVLLAVVGVISIAEFAGHRNLFVATTHRFFGRADYWGDQYRSGFLRVKGPFMGAEEAGIVFLIGFFLSLWLRFRSRSDPSGTPEKKYLGVRLSTWWIIGIAAGLAMTLSRGPLLGAAAGYLLARAGLVRHKRAALIVALVLIAAGGVLAYRKAAAYSRIYDDQATLPAYNPSEASDSAAYRTRLYEAYKTVAERGGFFGWSATAYPRSASFSSIDNEYLLLWVTQGKIGVCLFMLIIAEGGLTIVACVVRSRDPADIALYSCLGGMLVGLAVVLTTVFLAGQGSTLFFLCSGWIQSLASEAWAPVSVPRFAFRKVYT